MNRNRRWTRRRPKGAPTYVLRNVHPRRMDVNLSDLGYKIPNGQTRDLLAPENGLDPERVARSRKDGSVRKRLNQGVLVEIVKAPRPPPPRLSVAEPSEVSFPQRFKSLPIKECSDLSDSVAEAIVKDDDDFLREMDAGAEDGGVPVIAPDPEESEPEEEEDDGAAPQDKV